MAEIYKRGKIYWITFYTGTERIRESLKTKDKAEAMFKKKQIEYRLSRNEYISFNNDTGVRKCLDEYIKHQRQLFTERHAHDQEVRIGQFLKWGKILALKNIQPTIVEKYLAQRKKDGKKYWTLHHDLASIKSWLKWAVREHYLPANPITEVSIPKVAKREPKFLSKDEARRLLKNCEGDLKYMVAIALHTGAGPGELRHLRITDFDFKKNAVTLFKGKTQGYRTNPVNPKLLAHIRPLIGTQGLLFPYRDIPPKRQWDTARKAANLDIRFYDLRHTYISNLILDGVDPRTVGDLAGHADTATTMKYYSHLKAEHKIKAIKFVDY